MSERERNLIWRIFTAPVLHRSEAWEELARVCLAQFRAGFGPFIHDPWWANQITELNRISPKFRELWARQDVLNLSEGRKVMPHPVVGQLILIFSGSRPSIPAICAC